MLYILGMREVDLRRVDLNLLVALEALLEEKSVTRAARRLNMSQPAASRALARLRALFADGLLVESGGGYVLSKRAEDIRPILRATLAGVGAMLDAKPFDPALATGDVRLLMADLEAAALAPPLLARLAAQAPALNLDVRPPGGSPFAALESDAVDAIVGVIDQAPAGIQRRGLYDDRLVTLMRLEHPAAGKKLTLKRYLELGHIVVSITGAGAAPVDTALAAAGQRRRVAVRVPNFLAAVEIAAQTDLIMTLPSSLANTAAARGRFTIMRPPVPLAPFTMSLVWHARHQNEPRHAWLRKLIVDAAKDVAVGVLR
jgi:DNA-binding transcriptional LysR family regulator